MKETMSDRFQALIEHGEQIVRGIPRDEYGLEHYAKQDAVPVIQGWISSVLNLLRIVTPAQSNYIRDAEEVLKDKDMGIGMPSLVVQRIYGILTSASVEWENGLLREIEYIIVAEAFDDFLDHAAKYHKGDMKNEAAVLASAVLEDSIKRFAKKSAVPSKGRSLEELIDDLVKEGALPGLKAKRLKGLAGLRNHALHAEWDEFDIKDVGELINGLRTFIEDYL
jgi:uncharacterized protein YutE (UPF0331/DUF86 family)